MNLVEGKILDVKECDAVLDSLNERILAALSKPRLSADIVIAACDKLISALGEDNYLPILAELNIPEKLGKIYFAEARAMFSGEALKYRMKKELGEGYNQVFTHMPAPDSPPLAEQILPLGVLLHIAAGNADGLPAFSVLEGLLTGNINILKLPAAEGGMSVRILYELIQIEPLLAEYIYVFDYSSKDVVHINKLIAVADGVVVWGGIEPVSAFRSLLPTNTKLIEWGHKVSFAYVTKDGMEDDKLCGVATNIAATGQLLCSSAQGIFIDTDDMEEVYAFCNRFLPLLERAVAEHAGDMSIDIGVQRALQLYSMELETVFTGNRIFKGNNCSLVACDNQVLEPAFGFFNVWVKALPRRNLLETLRPYKNYLQTVALICDDKEKEIIADCLLKTGVVRVCSGERMSANYTGAPHDGEFSLRRYTKIASVE